jgi:hypothetical protein
MRLSCQPVRPIAFPPCGETTVAERTRKLRSDCGISAGQSRPDSKLAQAARQLVVLACNRGIVRLLGEARVFFGLGQKSLGHRVHGGTIACTSTLGTCRAFRNERHHFSLHACLEHSRSSIFQRHDHVFCMLVRSQMKNGVPMTAVRMPSGTSTCAMVRASVSMRRR